MVGVNKYRPENETQIDVCASTIPPCGKLQLDKLARLKHERDPAALKIALDALTARRGGGNAQPAGARGRRRAGQGHGRRDFIGAGEGLRPPPRRDPTIAGVFKREIGHVRRRCERVQRMVEAFEQNEGRRPRILVAKVGQDGHDRGQKVIASAFADLGFDVDIGPLFATPAEAARQAIENDVHILGVSSLAAGASHPGAGAQSRTRPSRAGPTS